MNFSYSSVFRIARFAAVTAAFLFALILLLLRYWLLPNIEQYRDDLAASISRAAGQRVEIADIRADWQGLRPHLLLQSVQIYDKQGKPVLYLRSLEGTLSWRTLLAGELRLHELKLAQINLAIHRLANGHIYLAGIPVNQPDQKSGFVDWILRQGNIVVQDATLLWQDDLRTAPPLVLSQVNLRLENSRQHHRFGISAVPPASLASPLDLRGDLEGMTLDDFKTWHGRLYVRLDYTDLAAWSAWLDLPYRLHSGRGGMQAWVDIDGGALNGITSDLQLAHAHLRLAENLPDLEVVELAGRVGWHRFSSGLLQTALNRMRRTGMEFQVSKLRLLLQDGTRVGPLDVRVQQLQAERDKLAEGRFEADNLSLEPLRALARYLPLSETQRQNLDRFEPRGSFRDFSLSWKGEWNDLVEYAAKGHFVNLGLSAYEDFPGVSGLSGHIDGNQKGGSIALNSRAVVLSLPKVFRGPLDLDTLTAQVAWKKSASGWDFKLTNVSLANADLAGTAYGTYSSIKGTPGFIDLTANFNRADARKVSKYLPVTLNQGTLEWLDNAFLAGSSNDVSLRLKGNLRDYPFVKDNGIFRVVAKISGGTLHYADGWPKIDNIAGDLVFEGQRMVVTTHQGNIFNTRLPKVQAIIPDLFYTYDELLEVDGEVEGQTAEFLRFIEESPVTGMINGFTEGMKAQGNGKLALKLHIPLRRTDDTKLTGLYQFIDNRIVAGDDIPPVEAANGKLQFSEQGVNVQDARAQILGGPATINAATSQDGTVRVNAQGRLTALGLQKSAYIPYAQFLRGSTNWRGSLTLRKKLADFVVESNLVGLGSDLPVPLNKKTTDSVPLRIEKKILGLQQDSVDLAYGQIMNLKLMRSADGDQMKVVRGVMHFGGNGAMPAQSGFWLTGALRYLDLDHWRQVVAQESGSAESMGLSGANLSVASLDAFGRRFSDLRMNAWSQQGAWLATLNGKELEGNAELRTLPQGGLKLIANFKHLIIPAAAPAKLIDPGMAQGQGNGESKMPALELTAENFQVRQRKLGKLEVLADQIEHGWRFQKLNLASADSNLQVDGVWQWGAKPLSRFNIKLDVNDLGKFLGRFGQPDSIKRGSAKLEGLVSWVGAPAEIDYATLTGNFSLEARNGQFMKVDPGIGKLLGILSLQALPRRITLDFRDVFSEGFAFDEITANVNIQKGLASSDDFKMSGPAAKVSMNGETDLARETQQLKVHVVPAIGEGVSMAGALLGGPAVGLTALLVQKVLRDPLGQIASYDYLVSGSWTDPKVSKVSKPAPAQEAVPN